MTNMLAATALARWTAALLVLSAILFVAAIALERRGESHETPNAIAKSEAGENPGHVAPAQGGAKQAEGNSERAESANSEAREAAEHAEAGESAEHAEGAHAQSGEGADHSEERLFGVDLESPWLLWGFVGASLVLALAVLRLWTPALLLAILLAGVAALLDVREVSMQFHRANNLIAGLALLIALLHVAAALTALLALRGRTRHGVPERQ